MNKKPLTKKRIFQILKKIKLKKLKSEKIFIHNSLGRILSNDVISKINLPPFNNSAVDGYAIRKDNLLTKDKLKCSKRITAGDPGNFFLENGEVARIFTGAKMPKNSNTVVMQENVKVIDSKNISISKFPRNGENCRLQGEDILKGNKIFNKGEKITSRNLNLLAAIGKKEIYVKEKLTVGYFTTGSELKKPSEKLKGSSINNSNLYSLQSLLKENYIISDYLGNLNDSKQYIFKSIIKNVKKYKVIITTGGASVGDEDHLIDLLKEKGKIFFWKTAIKPGRPLAIGSISGSIIICLPGNPVSVHLLYAMIIKPFLKHLCGSEIIIPKSIKAIINFSMKKKTKRLEWLRVKIKKIDSIGTHVDLYKKQGSAMISSMVYSDGIIEIPENVKELKKGNRFDFYLFDHLFN